MNFLTRSLTGVFILGLTLALLGFAAGNVMSTMAEIRDREQRTRPPRERVFSVNVEPFQLRRVTPRIVAFGEVASWRELELRATAGGQIVELADQFRDGGQIKAGSVIYRIDPTQAKADLALTQTQVKEAGAELIEARAALALAEGDLKAAVEQRDLRVVTLERQTSLRERGLGSEAAVETAALAVSSASQTVLTREQSLAQAAARILRAEIGVERQEIALAEAERKLSETVFVAPFDAIVAEVSAVEGRLVSLNEQLGRLIDRTALEVGFRVSNDEFSRILDARGQVKPVTATATLDLAGTPFTVNATVDRAGAEVGDGQSGRLIYARIDPESAGFLYSGDFMRVELTEPPIDNVAVVPATAISATGEVLIVGEEDRLEVMNATLLRRQDDTVILSDVPDGRLYVTRRQPQLGAGIKVKPVLPNAEIEEQKTVQLDDARRAKLIAAVEGNAYIPADAKTRIIANLNKKDVPLATVERLEARMGGAGNQGTAQNAAASDAPAPSGDTDLVELDSELQAQLIAFVEGNDRMPAAAKDRVLAMLRSGSAPAAMIERLQSRMGG